MVTGSGLAHLSECLGTMGIPTMSQPTFSAIESEIGQWWCDILKKDMLRAGAEEKRLAIERKDYHQGVPAITVVCDGGWSKRSHKHTYNALGGVGIVIGLATRKLLHIGVRNKFCYICATAEGQQRDPVDHECFKNWEESSQAMEADVIVEAFSKAEHDHSVRYMRLIADGDSSVFARIQETVPVWGPYVTKLECANHACKCLRSNLEKLVDRKNQYKGKGKLTQAVRVRLVSAVRCAIRMRSEDLDRQSAARKLAHDIQNSVFHVFGQHNNCSEFCKRIQNDQQQPTLMSSTESQYHETEENEMVIQVLNNQHAFWTDGSSLLSQDQSRIAISGTTLTSIEKEIIDDVRPILQRVASKSSRLLGNFTTNLAEAWMNVRAKFDGGKFFNRCQRCSWHARCYGGALRQNLGVAWSPTVWKKVTNTDPTTAFTVLYDTREKKIQQTRMLAARPVQKARRWKKKMQKNKVSASQKAQQEYGPARRWKKKMQKNKVSASQKAQQEYGPAAIDVVPDVSPDELNARMTAFVQSHLNIGAEVKKAIEESTHAQSRSDLWQSERRKRLTSSNFGDIIKRNTHIPILYGTFQGNKFTSVGLASEAATIVEYKTLKYSQGDPVSVEPKGLCIDDNHPFLAASTDGLITSATDGQQGLLEVKNLLQNKKLTFTEAAKSVQNFCLAVVNGKLQLKTSHQYFFQIQGQLNIFNLDWADFVVQATHPHQLHVQRVPRDENLWQTSMLPKLKAFYFKCLLPELAVPRYGKSPGIREPGNWVHAILYHII
ncbi:uncharacterized protein LOC126809647 [Patella vulgata]|uniref:uncharacterized protein LOC126809647 n=1 Tax=Patella vulgata TaxID=6465 RepID=UPI00217F5952|nr:uncharacterized protein LOC126809647 [Patella vulgata]